MYSQVLESVFLLLFSQKEKQRKPQVTSVATFTVLPKAKQVGKIMFGSTVHPNHCGLRITLDFKFLSFHLHQCLIATVIWMR